MNIPRIIKHQDKAYKIIDNFPISQFHDNLGHYKENVMNAFKNHYKPDLIMKEPETIYFLKQIPEAEYVYDPILLISGSI